MMFLWVALGGAIGASGRYALSLLLPVAQGTFPWATWWANIIGCICAGAFFAASERFVSLQGEWRLFLMVGILGGFTTFSSFGLESFQLLKLGHYGLVLSYVFSSVLVGICALSLSYYCFRAIIFQ